MNAERNLKLFLEKGYVTKLDRKLSLLLPFYSSQIAKRVFSKINTAAHSHAGSYSQVTPSAYKGDNKVVKLIQIVLKCRAIQRSVTSSRSTT